MTFGSLFAGIGGFDLTDRLLFSREWCRIGVLITHAGIVPDASNSMEVRRCRNSHSGVYSRASVAFDLGFERAGMVCKWQVEINEFCRRVLAKHWPDVPRYEDVRAFPNGDPEAYRVDVICGGFPCQDISPAGRRIGIAGERSGLWAEFARIIRVIRPRYVVVENSGDLVHRGLGRVLGDLAGIGFDAEWSVLSACTMGAAHMRKRLFIVANSEGRRSGQLRRIARQSEGEARGEVHRPEAEPSPCRELDGVPDRVDRLTSVGNAVYPAAAEWIGRRLMEFHTTTNGG